MAFKADDPLVRLARAVHVIDVHLSALLGLSGRSSPCPNLAAPLPQTARDRFVPESDYAASFAACSYVVSIPGSPWCETENILEMVVRILPRRDQSKAGSCEVRPRAADGLSTRVRQMNDE